MGQVTEGRLSTGVPYLKLGQGPPLLVASGLTPEHKNPTGMFRKRSLAWCAPFAEHFTVYLVNRKPGLAQGATIADLAADYADAIRQDICEPVLVHGTSTGGSVALQLAIDHPELVRRMVVAAAACRLSDEGRQLNAEWARLSESGDVRGASALVFETMAPRPLAPAARGMGWLLGNKMAPDDPSDMLITLKAEIPFDAEPQLGKVQAPTLVMGGTADQYYSEDLFRRTADGIPNGRAVLFPGKPHPYPADSKMANGIALGFLLGG